ncbi:hypothetical protein C8R44DRAFT_879176 [Mycena epipterygia]|nr:hypothetical protein C8R44DRAFT_879176 [Mycena epipterygia]
MASPRRETRRRARADWAAPTTTPGRAEYSAPRLACSTTSRRLARVRADYRPTTKPRLANPPTTAHQHQPRLAGQNKKRKKYAPTSTPRKHASPFGIPDSPFGDAEHPRSRLVARTTPGSSRGPVSRRPLSGPEAGLGMQCSSPTTIARLASPRLADDYNPIPGRADHSAQRTTSLADRQEKKKKNIICPHFSEEGGEGHRQRLSRRKVANVTQRNSTHAMPCASRKHDSPFGTRHSGTPTRRTPLGLVSSHLRTPLLGLVSPAADHSLVARPRRAAPIHLAATKISSRGLPQVRPADYPRFVARAPISRPHLAGT